MFTVLNPRSASAYVAGKFSTANLSSSRYSLMSEPPASIKSRNPLRALLISTPRRSHSSFSLSSPSRQGVQSCNLISAQLLKAHVPSPPLLVSVRCQLEGVRRQRQVGALPVPPAAAVVRSPLYWHLIHWSVDPTHAISLVALFRIAFR